MSWFVKFMVSRGGRVARVVAGLGLVAGGLVAIGGTAGTIVAIIGLVPLAFGTLDGCLFAPLFGYFLSGPRTRAAL